MYLETPSVKLMETYARARALPPDLLCNRRPQRLYLGNPYCSLVFPQEQLLKDIYAKADREGLKLTLVTAGLRWNGAERMDALLRFAQVRGCEVEANDFGTLERAARLSRRPPVLLGPQLNRRRKDPRIAWKAGMAAQAHLLEANAVNDALWRTWLAQFGVVRYEFERCGYDFALPQVPSSLHFPFYQTNTSMWCPLRGLCENGSRGRQPSDDNCPGWCNRNVLLYPDFLRLVGRWNSLLALDDRPWNPEFMNRFDRWVLNF